jgi:hypothetical protein
MKTKPEMLDVFIKIGGIMIPWKERINIFQIEPNAAALSEVSRMATELQEIRCICKDVMILLEKECPTGGVGPEGMTLEEMAKEWEEGRPACDDASFDVCQHAWNLLNNVITNHDNYEKEIAN